MPASVSSDNSLNYTAKIELGQYKKDLQEMAKATGQVATEALKDVKKEVQARQEQIGAMERVRAKLEELKAAQAKASASALPGINKDIEAYNRELKRLQQVGTTSFEAQNREASKFIPLIERMKQGAALYKAGIDQATNVENIAKYNRKLAEINSEIEKLSRAGKKGFDDMGQPLQVQQGMIQRLEREVRLYQKAIQESTRTDNLIKYNAKLKEAQQELERVKSIGKEGFDSFGRPLKEQLGLLGRLEKAATLYKNAIQTAPNPELIAKYNKKLQDTETQIKKTTQMGREGFDSFGNKLNSAGGFVNNLKSNIGQLAGAIGVTFGIAQLAQWGKQLAQVAMEASGIERAFTRIGGSEYLSKLRKETKGFVTDLELQKLAVQANNLGVPLKNLGTLLAFASQRAKDTGESVEKLTGDIINGLGRQSTRIIDNLGISQRAVNSEILKTGDFTEAVTKIIVRETAVAGAAVDTLADKAGRTTTTFSNFFKNLATGFLGMFNPDVADNQRIGDLTDRLKQKYKDFSTFTLAEQDRIIANQEKNIQAFDARLAKVNKEKDLGRYDSNRRGTSQINTELKDLNEQKAAAQNLVAELKKLNLEREKQERLAKGLITINELQEKQQRAQDNAYGESDPVRRKAFLKEAEDLQKQIDDILGKTQKQREKKEESAYQKALKIRKSLLEKISGIEEEYSRKSMTKEEAELQSIRDKFKKIKSEVLEFNRTNPGLKLGADYMGKLATVQKNAEDDLTYRMETERLGIALEEAKAIFIDYEKARESISKEYADQRYGAELEKAKKTFSDANKEREKLNAANPKNLTGGQTERKELLQKNNKKEEEEEREKYEAILSSLQTFEKERNQLIDKYQRERAALTAKANQAAVNELDKRFSEGLSALNRVELESSEVYKTLFEGVEDTAIKAARNLVTQARELLKNATLSPRDRKDFERFLRNTETALDARIPQAMVAVANNINGIASSVSNVNAAFASVLNTIAEVVGGAANIKTSLNAIKDIQNNPMGGLEDILGVASAAAGGIGAAISVATSLYNLFDQSEEKAAKREAERQAQLEKTQAAIEGINKALEMQAKVIERALGVDRIQAYRNQLGMLDGDISKTIDKINGLSLTQKTPTGTAWGDSIKQINVGLKKLGDQMTVSYLNYGFPATYTVTLDTLEKVAEANRAAINSFYEGLANGTLSGSNLEQVKELVASYEELETKLEQYKLKLQEVVTGTTFSSIVDSIAGGFRQGFEDAETEAKFFAQTFEDLMRDAIIQSLKFKALEKPLAAFYDQFALFSESGGSLDQSEITELRDIYNKIIEDANKQFTDLKNLTGVEFGTGNDNQKGLAGAVRGITADQADLLAGQFGGLRLHTAEILSEIKASREERVDYAAMGVQKVRLLEMIEVNTRLLQQQNLQTNAKLDSQTTILSSIERGVRESTDAIKANGG